MNILEEKKSILLSFKKLLKSNSDTFKIRKNLNSIYDENKSLVDFYNILVKIHNYEFLDEISGFNKIKDKYLESYTTEIVLENKYFQPYEFKSFDDSNSFKNYIYENNINKENFINIYNMLITLDI